MNSKFTNREATAPKPSQASNCRKKRLSNGDIGAASRSEHKEEIILSSQFNVSDGTSQHDTRVYRTAQRVRRHSMVIVASIQGSVLLFFIFAKMTAGNWSLQHQWIGILVLILLLINLVLISRNNPLKSGINANQENQDAEKINLYNSKIQHRWLGIAVALAIGITFLTGWMFTLDLFWGLLWVEWVHSVMANSAALLLFIYCTMGLYLHYRDE